jgi:hypothetical protein
MKRSKSKSLILPEDIPVAAESLAALERIGTPQMLGSKGDALVLVTKDSTDPHIVWASPRRKKYRAVWNMAAARGFVDAATEWGDNVDIDHVFPKSWATLPGNKVKYVRLFPVWAEINRSAGGGREKSALTAGLIAKRKKGIIYAEELQVLKILGHPVGTADDPIAIFDKKSRTKKS